MKKTRKLSIFELVWYPLTGAIAVWGLTFIVLGVVARNLKSTADLVKADTAYAKTMGLGFFNWGMILLAIGVVLAIIVLLVYAKQADREVEKQQRRAARLAASSNVEEASETPAE